MGTEDDDDRAADEEEDEDEDDEEEVWRLPTLSLSALPRGAAIALGPMPLPTGENTLSVSLPLESQVKKNNPLWGFDHPSVFTGERVRPNKDKDGSGAGAG